MVAQQFDDLNEELCQRNWYLYPIDVQQMWLIFMVNFQQATYIRGYGNIQCSRDSFKVVN